MRRVAASGGICVKTFFEDGFGDANDWPTPSTTLIDGVRQAASAHHLVLTMHANSATAWRFAADARADLIVHGMWNWDHLVTQPGDSLPIEIRTTLDSVIARKIGFMPTFRVLDGLASLYDSTFLADPRLGKVVPEAMVAWYQTKPGRFFADELAEGRAGDRVRAGLAGAVEGAAKVVRYLVSRNGRLVFGSDTPSAPTYGNPPGLNGLLELQRLASVGVPLDRLFAAATSEAARAFQLDSLYGTVEVGKVANLLLLGENPLETVTAYDAIELVVSRGRPIRRAELAIHRR